MGAFDDERRAFEARMSANFSALPIKYENVPFNQPVTGWVAFTIIPVGGDRITIGTTVKRYRYIGNLQIDIFVPEDTGSAVCRAHADTIESIFRDQQFSAGVSGTITCRTPAYITGGVGGGYYRGILNIPYQRDKNFS